jgi:hypothetical protein
MLRHRHAANRRTGAPPPECRRVLANLPAFLDGDLDGATHRAVQAHLDACADCRSAQEWQMQAEKALQSASTQIPPAGDLRPGFYARLAEIEPATRPSLRVALRRNAPSLGWGAAAITLLLALFPGRIARLGVPQPQEAPLCCNANQPIEPPRAPAPNEGPLAFNAVKSANNNKRSGSMDNRFVATALPTEGGNRSMARSHDSRPALTLAPRLPEIADTRTAMNHLPRIVLPLARQANAMALNTTASRITDSYAALAHGNGATDSFGYAEAGQPMRIALQAQTRAALLSEEVNVHIVNDRNEEVGSVHVAPANAATAEEASVVHIEAGADVSKAGTESEMPGETPAETPGAKPNTPAAGPVTQN